MSKYKLALSDFTETTNKRRLPLSRDTHNTIIEALRLAEKQADVTKEEAQEADKYFDKMCEIMALENKPCNPEIQNIKRILKAAGASDG